MTQRIIYIDQLKGCAILLVVVGHVLEYCFVPANFGYESSWHKLIYTFHMPLFAFLSGIFMKGINSWKSLRMKTERLLIPFLTIGSLYVLWRGFSLQSFFMQPYKYGYWYLWVMYLAFLPISLLEVLSKILNKNNRIGLDVLLFVGCFIVFSQAATYVGGGNLLSVSSFNYPIYGNGIHREKTRIPAIFD